MSKESFSTATYHVMRDHPEHRAQIPGGMFGTRVNASLIKYSHFQILQRILQAANVTWYKGQDQSLLNRFLWPICKHDLIAHDSYRCLKYPNIGNRAYPTQRIASMDFKNGVKYNFVGSNGGSISLNDSQPCPEQCRPKEHSEWLLC